MLHRCAQPEATMDDEDFSVTPLTAKQRLAISRYAITKHMTRGRAHNLSDEDDEADLLPPPQGLWSKLRFLGRSWWRNHPANYAVQIVRPSLDDYAAKQPFKLVGIAAAVGAVAVLIRPWRVLPMTALLLAPLKSSGFTSTAVTLFAPPDAD
jgi:hypothetical protein